MAIEKRIAIPEELQAIYLREKENIYRTCLEIFRLEYGEKFDLSLVSNPGEGDYEAVCGQVLDFLRQVNPWNRFLRIDGEAAKNSPTLQVFSDLLEEHPEYCEELDNFEDVINVRPDWVVAKSDWQSDPALLFDLSASSGSRATAKPLVMDLVPEPYIGNVAGARLVSLNLNPGFGDGSEYRVIPDLGRTLVEANFKLRDDSEFYYRQNKAEEGGRPCLLFREQYRYFEGVGIFHRRCSLSKVFYARGVRVSLERCWCAWWLCVETD